MASASDKHELIALEREGWGALSSDGATAREFYDRVLDDEVVMLLPGGLRLDDRSRVLDSMSGAPWASYELEQPHVLAVGEDAAVVAYAVVARRDGGDYSALVSSTYARRPGGWRLAFHQQTPR